MANDDLKNLWQALELVADGGSGTSEAVTGKYLHYLINRDSFRKEAEKHMTGSSGHRRVPKTFLERYQIPVPPIKDQIRIIAELDTCEQRICALKTAIVDAEVKKAEILKGYLS